MAKKIILYIHHMNMKHQFNLIPNTNPILHQQMPIFTTGFEELRDMLDEMFAFMTKAGGIGLAAPQVGIVKNFFIMNTDGYRRCVVNPVIIEKSKAINIIIEGCLSFPNKRIPIKRPAQVTVAYENEFGEFVTQTLNGISARCFLHEFDHTRGVCFTDYDVTNSAK